MAGPNPTSGAKNSLGIAYVRSGPPGLRAKLNEIIRSLDYLFPRPSADILPTVTPDGTFSRRREHSAASRISAPDPHPFQVRLADTSSATEPKAAISAISRLYKSISSTDTQAITDLTTPFILAANTCVWIQVAVSNLSATAAARMTGTAWPALVVTSGSPAAQTQFNIPVGRVAAQVVDGPPKPGFSFSIEDEEGTPKGYTFEQCLFSHLLVENRCNNGIPVLYAFPWGGSVPDA